MVGCSFSRYILYMDVLFGVKIIYAIELYIEGLTVEHFALFSKIELNHIYLDWQIFAIRMFSVSHLQPYFCHKTVCVIMIPLMTVIACIHIKNNLLTKLVYP